MTKLNYYVAPPILREVRQLLYYTHEYTTNKILSDRNIHNQINYAKICADHVRLIGLCIDFLYIADFTYIFKRTAKNYESIIKMYLKIAKSYNTNHLRYTFIPSQQS